MSAVRAHPTTARGESLTNLFQRPVESSFLISSSVSTIKWKGCLLDAEGACLPASRILSRASLGMSFVSYLRMLLRLNTTSTNDMHITLHILVQRVLFFGLQSQKGCDLLSVALLKDLLA